MRPRPVVHKSISRATSRCGAGGWAGGRRAAGETQTRRYSCRRRADCCPAGTAVDGVRRAATRHPRRGARRPFIIGRVRSALPPFYLSLQYHQAGHLTQNRPPLALTPCITVSITVPSCYLLRWRRPPSASRLARGRRRPPAGGACRSARVRPPGRSCGASP